MTAKTISNVLRGLGNLSIAEHSQRFFKTAEGEYGAGDRFLGIRVPLLRMQVKKYKKTQRHEILQLLHSPFHEERLFALLLFVEQFKRGDSEEKTAIYQLYLKHTRYINNWDLVDCSAHHIVGPYLEGRDRQILYDLARSENLWERRIAIMATLYWIQKNEFADAIEIADMLRQDREDLIHKSVGWMLREIGKRNQKVEETFLKKHYQTMPRTMLRYAIEKFPEQKRQLYLKGMPLD